MMHTQIRQSSTDIVEKCKRNLIDIMMAANELTYICKNYHHNHSENFYYNISNVKYL
jgi:hypothetical protein